MPFEVGVAVEAGKDALVVIEGVVVLVVADVADVEVDVALAVDVDARVLPAVAVPEVRYAGAGTAVEGSVRAPGPQGIFSPLG